MAAMLGGMWGLDLSSSSVLFDILASLSIIVYPSHRTLRLENEMCVYLKDEKRKKDFVTKQQRV